MHFVDYPASIPYIFFPTNTPNSPLLGMCCHPKRRGKETTPAQRAAVWTRHCSGYSVPKIIALEGLPRSTVRSILRRREESSDSSFKSKPRSGRPKKTSTRDDRALLRAANNDTKATLYCSCNSEQIRAPTWSKYCSKNPQSCW